MFTCYYCKYGDPAQTWANSGLTKIVTNTWMINLHNVLINGRKLPLLGLVVKWPLPSRISRRLFYRICPNRSECKGLHAHILISVIKSIIQYLQYAYIYGTRGPCGPLFTRKWRFAHVQQPNRPEYRSNFTVSWWSFAVLSDIWCEFDVICLLLERLACLLKTALLLGHIR